MNWEPIRQTIASLLGALGGVLIGKGYVSAELWAQIVGAVLMLLQIAYTIYTSQTKKLVSTVAALDKVAEVRTLDLNLALSTSVPDNVVFGGATVQQGRPII